MKQQHSFAISSIIRQNRSSKEGLAPVYLRITCDSKRSEISVHISVEPTKWNSAKGRVKGTSEDVRRLNQGIETFEHRAREIHVPRDRHDPILRRLQVIPVTPEQEIDFLLQYSLQILVSGETLREVLQAFHELPLVICNGL